MSAAYTGVNVPHILFDPGPGTAQEVGVMLGFIAAFVLSMSVYLLFWKRTSSSFLRGFTSDLWAFSIACLGGLTEVGCIVGNKRSERKELARRTALIQQGESALGESGVELEVLGERFDNDTLRRWTWGGVQAF